MTSDKLNPEILLEAGVTLEALTFPTYRNGKATRIPFMSGRPDETASIIEGMAVAYGCEVEDIELASEALRIAHQHGLTYKEQHEILELASQKRFFRVLAGIE